MVNTGEVAVAQVSTPGGRVCYTGQAAIDGVPGTAAAVPLLFEGLAGSMCGALLPTGRVLDRIDGVACTLIDNGMPVVVMDAADFGLTGREARDVLEADSALAARIEAIWLQAGVLMALGDVRDKSVPKMMLVSAPGQGGGDQHAQLDSASCPCLDRRVCVGQRGDRLPDAGQSCGGAGGAAEGWELFGGASLRRVGGVSGNGSGRSRARGWQHPHRAKAV